MLLALSRRTATRALAAVARSPAGVRRRGCSRRAHSHDSREIPRREFEPFGAPWTRVPAGSTGRARVAPGFRILDAGARLRLWGRTRRAARPGHPSPPVARRRGPYLRGRWNRGLLRGARLRRPRRSPSHSLVPFEPDPARRFEPLVAGPRGSACRRDREPRACRARIPRSARMCAVDRGPDRHARLKASA